MNGAKLFHRFFVTPTVLILAIASLTWAAERSPGDRFAIAIEKGDLDAVKELVEGGAKADTLIEYGEHKITPLMKACWEGQQEIAAYLLDSGANVNAADEMGQTALVNAVTQGSTEIAEMLIKHGANVNLKDFRQFTPVMLAASAGDERMVEALARAKADLNAEAYGLTPLVFAMTSKKVEVVKLLVKLGASVNYASKYSAKGGDPGTTALFSAIYSGDADMVRFLIELKANVNVKTKSGNTPLKAARQGDQEDIIAILKEAGAKK